MIKGYPPAPTGGKAVTRLDDAASVAWVRRVVDIVNNLLMGKQNVVLPITLVAGVASTTIIDGRITASSSLLLQPLTAHAAAALYGAPYVLVSAQQSGSVTFAHVNDANADKNFNLLILG